jgi:hypothetical protein
MDLKWYNFQREENHHEFNNQIQTWHVHAGIFLSKIAWNERESLKSIIKSIWNIILFNIADIQLK